MQKFVFKVNWISHELLHKDGKVEGDLDCFDFCASPTVASTVSLFLSVPWSNMSLVSLFLSLSLSPLRHWSSHHAGLRLWCGAHLAVP